MINFYNILFYIYHSIPIYVIFICVVPRLGNARASFHKVIMEQGRNVQSKTETGLKTFDFILYGIMIFVQLMIFFLAPTGAQEVTLSVRDIMHSSCLLLSGLSVVS